MKPERSGQITVFVLLGVVLLVAVAGSIYLFQPSQEPTNADPEFDEAVAPVTNDIRRCTNSLVNDRVRELAEQGGLTDDETNDLLTNINRDAYRLDGIDYYGDDEIIVPYWLHSEDSPDCTGCTTTTRITPLTGDSSFQSRTEQYVEDNIKTCLDDFQRFEDTLSIDAGEPDATVRFNQEDTTTTLEWDITLEEPETGSTYDVETVQANAELPIRSVYESAMSSLRKIRSSNLPETYVQKLLAYLSLEEQIPPVKGGISIGLGNDVWVRDNIRSTVKQSLANYASLINIIGPNEAVPTYSSPDVANFAGDFTLVADNESSSYDIETTIRPTWPVFLRVDGSDAPIITPDTTSFGLKFLRFGFTNKDFTYDVSYPMTVSITDTTTPREPLTLRFGVEGNIRNSQSYDETTYAPPSQSNSNLDLSGLGANNITVFVDGPTTSNGAVQLRCAGETTTQRDRNPDRDGFQVQLPSCTNGEISYQGSLLQSNTVNTSIPRTGSDPIRLETKELKQYNVSVSRRPVFNINNPSPNITYNPTPVSGVESAVSPVENNIEGLQPATYVPANTKQDPIPGENITVIFTQQDGEYATSTTLNAGTSRQPVELFPGDYNVQSFAEFNLDSPIQAHPEEICVDGGFWSGDECQTIPGQSIPSGQEGAVRQCVGEQVSNQEFNSFTTGLEESDQTALDFAQTQGYDIQSCVDEQLSYRDNTITTGGFTDANNSLTISGSDRRITMPYFAYNPDQINVTRDMMIMSSVLRLAEQTREFDELQPRTTG